MRTTILVLSLLVLLVGCGDEDPVAPVVDESGKIMINPSPDSINAPWTIAGPDGFSQSNNGDQILNDLSGGEYVVTWGAFEDWVVPVEETQTLSSGATIIFNGIYVEPGTGTVVINPLPGGLAASWEVTGPEGYSNIGTGSQTALSGLLPGDYSVVWGEVTDWVTPPQESRTVDAGAIEVFSGIYVEMQPPVVPTGVHSISGDNLVTVQWYDISYFPYDGQYNANVVNYLIYSRFFEEGDIYNPDRAFFLIGEVAWDENFDPATGMHWFEDVDAVNGERYEYAVSAVNSVGAESALSYEFVTDAPLPMGLNPVPIFGADGPGDPNSTLSGFDFSDLNSQPVDPWAVDSEFDVRVSFQGAVPYVHAAGALVRIQDCGVFVDAEGFLIFEGVSWAPEDYYSSTGVLELIPGHIYVVEIQDTELHYAKFGVVGMDGQSVSIIWAYQTISGLPELKIANGAKPVSEDLQR